VDEMNQLITATEIVQKILSAGQEPTVDQLGEALAEQIEQRDFYKGVAEELMEVMSTVVGAYMTSNPHKLNDTLDEFIKKRVKRAPQSSPLTH
jgi:translation initiation factor 2B subunit (eIF-2B alpha/beta/delta family)